MSSSYSSVILWVAAIFAFMIGYAIVSFLMKVFKGDDGSNESRPADPPPGTIPPESAEESPKKTMEKFASITRNQKEQE